jgi:hypothetical protein
MHTTTNIHNVTSITVEAKRFGGELPFVSTEFTFANKDGENITVSAFSRDFLQIVGAEHVNAVASNEKEPA